MTLCAVQFSTGLGSAELAYHARDVFGASNVVLQTADTLEEHPDNWRFAAEVVADLQPLRWERLTDGRTPMQVGRDRKCIPNNRMTVCSEHLKRRIIRRHLEANYAPADLVVWVGYDWTEPDRWDTAQPRWAPWTVEAPWMTPRLFDKADALATFQQRHGIEPPELYRRGFPHANCGGACVRGGQAQWELLLRTDRPRYLRWEAEEARSRAELGKDVAILRDRTGGTTRPLTLQRYRQRLDDQPGLFDADDWGACGCT